MGIEVLRTLSEQDVAQLVIDYDSLSSALQSFGIASSDARARALLMKLVESQGLVWERRKVCKASRKYNDQDVRDAVAISFCINDVLKILGLASRGGNANTIKRIIGELGIDTSHFDISKARRRGKIEYSLENIQDITNASTLRKVLLKYGSIAYECSICKISDWNEHPITLQIDHIDGNRCNNQICNLRLLCPNCHSQTPTYGRKKRAVIA